MSKASDAERQSAIAKLQTMLKPGDTVRTILRHVSRSGMSRRVSVVICRSGEGIEFDRLAARVLGYRLHKDGGLVVGGGGMDMGFAVVYELGRALWPKGFDEGFPVQVRRRGRQEECGPHGRSGHRRK